MIVVLANGEINELQVGLDDTPSIASVASIVRDASTLQRPKGRPTTKLGPSRCSMRSASMSATSAGQPRDTASNQWAAATGTKVNLDMDASERRLARTPGMCETFPEIVLSTSRLGNWSRQQGQSGNSALVVAPRVGACRADIPQERLNARGAARAHRWNLAMPPQATQASSRHKRTTRIRFQASPSRSGCARPRRAGQLPVRPPSGRESERSCSGRESLS